MTTEGFLLRGLYPTVGLEALAELGEAARELWDGGLSGRIEPSVLQSELLFFVPRATAELPVFRSLVDVLETRAPGRLQRQQYLQRAPWPPLERVLPLLLLESGRDGELVRPRADEWFLIDERGDAEQAAKLFEDLRFHATHTYVSASADSDGPGRWFFHVLADPKRQPSLDGWMAGGGFDGLVRLAAFRSEEQTVFLPLERAPSAGALVSFRRAVAARYGPGAASAERLMAVDVRRRGDGASWERAFWLFPLVFSGQASLTPRPSAAPEIEVLALEHSPHKMRELRAGITRAEPLVGHRLELRTGYATDDVDVQKERLAEDLAELEQKWVYLSSLQRPRPVLMRFTPHQLPALADALRCFSPSDVKGGKILYGFQATRDQPAGWHYLYYDPTDAVQLEPYPPWRWRDLPNPRREAVRFWLDPFWAHDYHTGERADAGEECLVFVPHGRALFPALHSWRPEQMDVYLRELLEAWFPGDAGVTEIPRRALYLFDDVPGRDGGADGEIRIQVLDLDGFAPLDEQIGWINDNLALRRALGGAEGLITALADRARRQALDEDFTRRAEEAAAAFRTAADKANLEVARDASELLGVMTAEIAEIAQKSGEARDEIERRHAELDEAVAMLERLKAAESETRDAFAELEKAAGKNAQLVHVVFKELKRLESERIRLELQVKKDIARLEETHDQLLERLRSRRP